MKKWCFYTGIAGLLACAQPPAQPGGCTDTLMVHQPPVKQSTLMAPPPAAPGGKASEFPLFKDILEAKQLFW